MVSKRESTGSDEDETKAIRRISPTRARRSAMGRAPDRSPLVRTARPGAALELLQELDLHLLHLGQALPLPGEHVVDLLVQVPDLQFRLQVHAVIVERAQPVLRLR